MKSINWNKTAASLEQALTPAPLLIDGRTERDRLAFLSQLASLINFYDHTNSVNGNWVPFLLKDPVILLAHISKTDYAKPHTLYLNTCSKLEQLLNGSFTDEITVLTNQLFDQLTRIFQHLERWTKHMQPGPESYGLKKYLIQQVKQPFSGYLWAMLSLRESLFLSEAIGKIHAVDYPRFENFDLVVWRQSAGKEPFWKTLDMPMPPQGKQALSPQEKLQQAQIVFGALQTLGDTLFSFFSTIIRQSQIDYGNVDTSRSHYPDTTLLRAFVHLLKTHRDQLNGVTQKHLDFYYHDILLQAERLAVADKVFISAALGKNVSTFDLPAATNFSAGNDANNNPIWFASTQDVSLNSATIAAAFTLSQFPNGTTSAPFYQQAIAAPSTVQTDESGAVLPWETFGGSSTTQATLGFAFASPMLLLREGKRMITITLNFSEAVDVRMLQSASYFMSTQKAWTPVAFALQPTSGTAAIATLTTTLQPTDPAIEPFLVNPDNLSASWPMLKILFSDFYDLAQPPVISTLSIDVNVTGVQTFQLYNDNGLLSTKTPFQLFGPIPGVNSQFIIGSNEMFSKPLKTFDITLNWNNLPTDFGSYYTSYNNYIAAHPATTPTADEVQAPAPETTDDAAAKTAEEEGVITKAWEWLLGVLLWISGASEENEAKAQAALTTEDDDSTPTPYNNNCFLVELDLFQDNQWNTLSISTPAQTTTAASDNSLFYVNNTPALNPSTTFYYASPTRNPQVNVDPSIQNSAMQFTDASTYGFLKMELTSPSYGFGSSIYPNVVTDIALQNAILLSGTQTKSSWGSSSTQSSITPDQLVPSANAPFAPKVTSISGDYEAYVSYDLTKAQGDYPLQCFYYAPFANYTVYDNSLATPPAVNDYIVGQQVKATPANGVRLFPEFPYNGVLFIALSNLTAGNLISLYFELARSFAGTATAQSVSYYYLSESGWNGLLPLQDSTNGFSCPGIVELNLPLDIATQSPVMPAAIASPVKAAGLTWIAVAATGDPQSFAQTVVLLPNGVELQRSGTTFLTDTTVPKIAAGAITKPQTAIAQLATIAQPFASFGGKAAEDQTQFDLRVSSRIKTKDRAVTKGDLFLLIRRNFDDIYYSKSIFDPSTNTTQVYVVKGFDSPTEANAFTPLVSECREKEIQSFLLDRMPLYSNVEVSNFTFRSVQVQATIAIKTGYAQQAVQDNVVNAINLFLSPWIKSNAPQLVIDTGLSEPQLAGVISSIAGVASVTSVTLFVDSQVEASSADPTAQFIASVPGSLFVSSMDHLIQFAA